MTQPSSGTPERETGVDRFEHEIEDLEQSSWRENRGRFLVFIGVALGAAAIIVGAFLLIGIKQRPADTSKTTIMSIELTEPRPVSAGQKPTHFSWESIANTATYLLKIREAGGERNLVDFDTARSAYTPTRETEDAE